MINICPLLSKYAVRLRRITHRGGYGLQSPFAFNLEREVINQRLPYYAYQSLSAERKSLPRQAVGSNAKVDALLFRLSNYVQPSKVVMPDGGWYMSHRYIAMGCKKASISTYFNPQILERSLDEAGIADMLIIPDTTYLQSCYDLIKSHLGPKSLLIVDRLYCTKSDARRWQQFLHKAEIGVSFDLHCIGLLFTSPDYARQDYIIDFHY